MNGEGEAWRFLVGKFKDCWWTPKCGALLGTEHSSQPSCPQKAGRKNEDQCQNSRHRFESCEGKVGFLFEAGWRNSHALQWRDAPPVSAHPIPRARLGRCICFRIVLFTHSFAKLFHSSRLFLFCFAGFCLFCFFTWDYCSTSGLSQRISLAREEILSDVNKINQERNQPLEKKLRVVESPWRRSWGTV